MAHLNRIPSSTFEHPFPAALDDCLHTYRHCLEEEKGSKSIALVGDSAGGLLVLETLIEARDAGLEQPLTAALLSPVTDLTQSGSSYNLCTEHDPFMDRALFAKDIAHYLHGADSSSPSFLIAIGIEKDCAPSSFDARYFKHPLN